MHNERVLVFLAEDDQDDQVTFLEALIEVNLAIEVKIFENGFSLLKGLGNGKLPSLIILDLNMPLLNGLETLTELKKNEQLKDIPKLVWSTSENAEVKYACLQLGANDYFEKPDTFSRLLVTIGDMMKWIA